MSSGADREELTIRPAVDSDAPGISALIESQLHHRSPTPTGLPPPEFLAGFATDTIRGHIGSPRCRYLVALVEDRVVGVIGMRDERSILHLFVADSWQRRGVGRALWARARSELLASADEVTLVVNSSVNAVPVYERFGFEAIGPRVEGAGVTYVPMRLILEREPG